MNTARSAAGPDVDVPPSGLRRALQVINRVASSSVSGIGVSAVARDLNLPKAVVHRILKVLADEGFLNFNEETKRYVLGAGALELGLTALRHLDVPVVARPYLESLVERSTETATLSIRQGWTRSYIEQIPSPHEIRMTVRVGQSYPLHAGSSSKAILAALPDYEIEEYLRTARLEALTGETIVATDRLRAEIGEVRAQGFALSRGERQIGAGSAAAAICYANGTVFGSISLCGPLERFDEARHREYGRMVRDAAAEISVALGHRHLARDDSSR